MSDRIDDFLAHYGVKGMRWGVRKEYEPVGRDPGKGDDGESGQPANPSTPPSSGGGSGSRKKDYTPYKETEADRVEQARRKYGPDSMSELPADSPRGVPGWDRLSDDQKKAALAVGGAAALAGLFYVGYRYSPSAFNAIARSGSLDVDEFLRRNKWAALEGFPHDGAPAITLPPGSILQRMSSKVETSIRPSGFFAAFDQQDVESYKANIPKLWPQWGIQAEDGYLTQIRANAGVRTPSAKETLDLFKRTIVDDDDTLARFIPREALAKLSSADRARIVDSVARSNFPAFTASWANGYDQNPSVQKFFDAVRKDGYNALIDFNDRGMLASRPVRVIDSGPFEIVANTLVPRSEIDLAQRGLNKAKEVAMSDVQMDDAEEFLEHYGVKGMKWGTRRTASSKTSGEKRTASSGDKKSVGNKIASNPAVRRARGVRKRDISKMSDTELQSRLRRLNMEKQYQSLSGNKPADKIATDWVSHVAKTSATAAATGIATKLIKDAVERKLGIAK